MSTIPITRRGAEMLREELHRLETKERPAVANTIVEACAQDDLSENIDYDIAREHQGFIEGRIQEVKSKLSVARIVDPAPLDADGRMAFSTTIDLEDLDSGKSATYQIVGDDEADLETGKVSASSPIARALIGKSEGDVTTVVVPGGEYEHEALTVEYL